MRKPSVCAKESFCQAMENRVGISELRGFDSVTLLNIPTGKSEYIGVRYRTSGKDKGIMLNFCPWCGSNIQFWKAEAKLKPVRLFGCRSRSRMA